MSTTDLGRLAAETSVTQRSELTSVSFRTLLLPLASLRLTVVLFALSLILVLAGTLAQIDHEIWYVVHNYFRAWFAWIDFQVFFPRDWKLPGGFWFPGGWLIGAALGTNLLLAHALRFKVAAKGSTLGIGFGMLFAGIGLTWMVIQSGLDDTVESELSPEFCNGLWHALRFALGAGTLGLGYALTLNYRRMAQSGTNWLWWLGAITGTILMGLTLWLFTHPEAQLDASGLRIMWQLIKSTAAGLVLLAGCYWVFGRRAGIVLLHGGVGLLMFSELWTGLHAQESQMRITEGQTVSYAVDQRSTELAIVDKSDPTQDRVTVVPLAMLLAASESDQTLDDPALPFLLRLVKHYPNSRTRFLQPGETSLANRGVGLLKVAEELGLNSGVGKQQGLDVPALYVEVLSREEQQSLGTLLLSPFLIEEPLELDGKTYEIALQFKRIHKPYTVKLIDFRHDLYLGTGQAKNFSSEVQLKDPQRNVDRTFKIWMNNPLRYGGDTLYQASFDPDDDRVTTLQVMTNSGWMIPYVSCMLVAIGMFAQFGSTFLRFARRKAAPAQEASGMSARELLAQWKSPTVWVPALLLFLSAGYVFGGARVPKIPATEMQLHQFGQLPVAYNGRVKPFDTVARNALTVLSGKGALEMEDPQRPEKKIKKPAMYWFLEFLAGTPASRQHPILRIENLDVLQTLDLKPRSGFRYSLVEVLNKTFEYDDAQGEKQKAPEVLRQAQLASATPEASRNLTQMKFLQLGSKLTTIHNLKEAFFSPAIRTDSLEHLKADFQRVSRQIANLNSRAPQPVPPTQAGEPWQTLLEAERDAIFQQVQKKEVNAATLALRTIFDAYATGDVQKFNDEVAAYQKIVKERAEADAQYDAQLAAAGNAGQRKTAEKLSLSRVRFEAFFNHFNPFTKSMALYLVAFVLAGVSWLGPNVKWSTTLNRSANWLLWFTFLLHTYALVCRIYISGRPPVTNLYSSAVFIGWAAVLFALVFEKIYRFGIGNLLAAMIGFPTLFIAYNLAGDGDTFQVLQAVLDTQFWLATHVVCITLGYSTTLLAGVLGLVYVLMGLVGNRLSDEQRQQLIRMTYGTLCFATFFSFIGTVLGGLWADDSWGRFWGWDPKENGALLIVIWNALVLHARWGAMIRQRGLAILAIFGNVITAWSWFGVNQMGEGLHAYGFRKGMTFWICVFVASQLLVMLVGCLPADWWRGKSGGEAVVQEA
ncbi:MAG: cytochrome c biogenesis protein CcsA [Planctomycetes bacterium]|nr:cytochrome c biogenesis protein CcsA [Planctomycetota bacterium]